METPQLSSLYQQVILEHYRSPRNKGELPEHTVEVHMLNPSCGDEIKLQLRLEDDTVREARFTGQGCSISQASVSMMTHLLKGASVEDALALARRFTRVMHGDEEAARDRSLGDLRALAGVSKFPVRVKCALLGFDALQEALKKADRGPFSNADRTGGGGPGGKSGEQGEEGESANATDAGPAYDDEARNQEAT